MAVTAAERIAANRARHAAKVARMIAAQAEADAQAKAKLPKPKPAAAPPAPDKE